MEIQISKKISKEVFDRASKELQNGGNTTIDIKGLISKSEMKRYVEELKATTGPYFTIFCKDTGRHLQARLVEVYYEAGQNSESHKYRLIHR